MTIDQFITTYDGTYLDFDHQFGNQCVDLVATYCVQVLGHEPYYANAADWWYNYDNKNWYTKIPNSPAAVPQKGDIVIWDHSSPGSGGAGHIDVWLSGDINGFIGFDQNWPVGSVCHRQGHNYNYIVGWLRPKGNIVDKITKEQENTLSQLATGGNPGSGYDYRFTGLDCTQANWDKCLQFWIGEAKKSPYGLIYKNNNPQGYEKLTFDVFKKK